MTLVETKLIFTLVGSMEEKEERRANSVRAKLDSYRSGSFDISWTGLRLTGVEFDEGIRLFNKAIINAEQSERDRLIKIRGIFLMRCPPGYRVYEGNKGVMNVGRDHLRGFRVQDYSGRNDMQAKDCAAPGESKHKCTRKPIKRVKGKKTHRNKK